MEQTTKQKMSMKKKASAVVAGVLVTALALGGAYAWTDYTQHARNTLRGTENADVLLHDDFNGENKDVYVENVGESEVFVRVKFAEYLQIGNTSVLTAYTDSEESEGTSEEGTSAEDTSVVKKADSDDVTTWPVHQFKNAAAENNICNFSTHSYFEWKMTGAQKAYLAGVTESNSEGYGGLSEDAFNALSINQDVILGDITTQKKNTLAQSDVMMLSDWLALVEAIKNGETGVQLPSACWLLDTDGWAYWSEALQPGTATNLLLDEVVATEKAPHDNWVYHIDVQLQAATITEMEAWFRDGIKDVANPDNSKATATEAGYDFIVYRAGDYMGSADGTIMGVDGESYRSVAGGVYVNVKDEELDNPPYVLAGQDGKLGTEDDNKLAGRSAENGGGVEVENVDIEKMTYTIAGASADYVVTVGIDKKLGTYDDVITAPGGQLGKYNIDDVGELDLVGWNYLGGPVTNMLVATEYVLDNAVFNQSGAGNSYAGSELQTKIKIIGDTFITNGMTAEIVPVNLDMSDKQHTGNQVLVCVVHEQDDAHDDGTCNSAVSIYYTNNKGQADIENTTFFALSLKEVLDAYGDSSGAAIRELRSVQGAPAYVQVPGQSSSGKNWNNSKTWTDGDGNFITSTNYWLRSPGFTSNRAAYLDDNGNAVATSGLTGPLVGARPACYLNLSTTTATE